MSLPVEKSLTETYRIDYAKDLDPITVYATNYRPRAGKLVIECSGQAWAHYWGGMGDQSLQAFVAKSDNDYLLEKFLRETRETDFDAVTDEAQKRGFRDLVVTNDVEVAMLEKEMSECFGPQWMMDLPRRHTAEYRYLGPILDAVKAALS